MVYWAGALTKRVFRILQIVQIVANNPCTYSRADLAERFQVSERMIQKDLDMIRHGLKLELGRKGNGYYF